jgi:hypothetical protein
VFASEDEAIPCFGRGHETPPSSGLVQRAIRGSHRKVVFGVASRSSVPSSSRDRTSTQSFGRPRSRNRSIRRQSANSSSCSGSTVRVTSPSQGYSVVWINLGA